jgi:N-acetylglucosamine kinase-like BadF-type ATPase
MSLKLGVDGGGTKTECILVDGSGEIIASHRAEGCNPSIIGPKAAKRVVADALSTLLSQPADGRPPGSISMTLLCMAGSRIVWSDFAASLADLGHVVAVDDSLPVLELATNGGPGLVLHAGTGSFVAARAPREAVPTNEAVPVSEAVPFGVVHYAGGLGWRIGDPGSGYDIGRRAVARGLLELQGWMPDSGIGRLLQDYTGLKEANAISRDFNREKTANSRTAGLAPDLLRLAESGNAAARDIAVESAAALLALALRVVAKLFSKTPPNEIDAGLSGPILTHPIVARALQERAPFALRTIGDTPIEGVRRLLVRMG